MADPRTIARLEARIKERVAHAVEFELADPRSSFITVTRVELNRDVSRGRIFYSVLGTPGDRSKARAMLEDASGFLQRKVGRVLNLRRMPRLTWHYDDTIEAMVRMDDVIRQALAHDEEIHPGAHAELLGEARTQREYEDELAEQEAGRDPAD